MAGRPEIASHGVEGDALLVEVASTLETLRRLLAHPWLAQAPEKASLAKGTEQVDQRLSRTELAVVVTGPRSAGKTTFIDALFGDRRLGQARGRALMTTYLRRAGHWDFVATLGPSRSERFSELFPDQSKEFEPSIAAAETARAAKERECELAAERLRAADETLARAETEGQSAFAKLESARESAMGVSQELYALEQDAKNTETALVAIEREVPRLLRTRAPWWAFWVWMFRAIFVLVRRGIWQRYQAERQAFDRSTTRLRELRESATATAVAATEVETRLATSGEEADEARAAARSARDALDAARAELARAERDLEARRSELEAYRDALTQRFFAELHARSEGPTAHATAIEIQGPAPLLPDDVVLIDAPALTEGSTEERARAWLTVADRADGCILLAELDRAVAEKAKRFLQEIREVVPHVLLVLTKMDKAFVNAVGRGASDPWEQVEQARRIGTRRFAREVGRSPDQVLSIAVAAQAALDDPSSGLATRFEAEIAKLFQLLRHERALIIGMRAASAVRRCIAGAADAEKRADQAYAERIAALEANRLPQPDEFRRQELERAEPQVEEATERALAATASALDEPFRMLRASCFQHIGRARSAAEIRSAATSTEQGLATGFAAARAEIESALEQAIDRAVREIEVGMFAHLRERYGLIHDIRRSQSSLPRLGPAQAVVVAGASVLPAIESSLRSLSRLRWALAGGGAVGLALIGTLIAPGLGTVAGAGLGALLALVPLTERMRERARAAVELALNGERTRIAQELGARGAETREAIRGALDRSLERAIERFGRMIAEPLEAEQQAINRERNLRAELSELYRELEAHDARLGKLAKAATEASIGLCR